MDDITPSHPNFDRSGLTDQQFIEQLLFEIKEMRSTIERKDLLIKSLQGNLNIDTKKISTRKSWEVLKKDGTKDEKKEDKKEAVKEDKKEVVKEESKEEEKLEKDIKVHEDHNQKQKLKQKGNVNVQPVEQMKQNKDDDLGINNKLTDINAVKQSKKDNIEVNDVIEELQVVPQRSARRRPVEDARNGEKEFKKDEENIHSILSKLKDVNTNVKQDQADEPVEASQPESNRSSVYSDDKPELNEDQSNTTVEPDINESINTTIEDPEESKNIISSLKSNDTLMLNKNQSNSSFQSYKSRIKLPTHLQDDNSTSNINSPILNNNKSMESLPRENAHHDDGRHELSPQGSRHTLSPYTSRISQQGYSQSMSTSQFNHYPNASGTTDDSHKVPISPNHTPIIASEPPRIPLPLSPDDSRHAISPKGISHSKTSKDLNINHLTIPPNNNLSNNNSLRSPAIIAPELYQESSIPQTPKGFYTEEINESASNVSSPAQTQYTQSPAQINQYHNDELRSPLNNISQDSINRQPSNISEFSNVMSQNNTSYHQLNQSFTSIGHGTVSSQGGIQSIQAGDKNRSNISINDDDQLFIKPEDFQTITIKIVSTISVGNLQNQSRKLDDVFITISVNDRASGKEMWRIRKNYTQLISFDNEIRPVVEYFGLPVLPDKSLFFSTTPNKIDLRKNGLQNYFNTLFVMPHIPHLILFRICKYLSLDFINPLDDFKSGSRKEGYLVRRYKSLGTSWKIRWCQVDGPQLEIYDAPGGSLIETINLINCQIGRQSNDSVAEDKGYRHAFLVMENTKSKLTSIPKHFFCAESDEERDDWVNILIDTGLESSNSSIIEDTKSLNDRSVISGDNSSSTALQTPKSERHGENDEVLRSPPDERKLNKKRSIFPFRKNNSNNSNSTNASGSQIFDATNIDSDLSHTITPPTNNHQPQNDDMQQYLDKMGLDENLSKSIFGRDLATVYEISHHEFLGRLVPSIVYRCVEFLIKAGALYEEGIFRLSGSASMIRSLKDSFNKQFDVDLLSLKPDIHTVAGLFKTYLRELPEPIITEKLMNELRHIIMNRGEKNKNNLDTSKIVKSYMKKLDKINYNVTFIIIKFLKEIINNCQVNKMNLRNVCIVFVPTLNISLDILSLLLVDFDFIFENGEPVPDNDREVLEINIPNF